MERDEEGEAVAEAAERVNELARGFDDAYEKIRPIIIDNLQAHNAWANATNVYGLYVNIATPIYGGSLIVRYPEPDPGPKIVLEV